MNWRDIDFNTALVMGCFEVAELILFPVQIDEMSEGESQRDLNISNVVMLRGFLLQVAKNKIPDPGQQQLTLDVSQRRQPGPV